MKTIQTCTLALEFNYGKPTDSKGSVWLFNGDGRAALRQSAPLAELPGWYKIVGPIDYQLASQIQDGLKRFFSQQGVTVIDEGIAD